MHARVVRLAGSTDKVDAGIENYASRVVPALREQEGYSGARLLVDRDTGSSMSITFWANEAAAEASFQALASIRDDATQLAGAAMQETHLYEAAVQHRPKTSEKGNWVRLTTLKGDPAKVDDGLKHFTEQTVPAFEAMPGFRAAVLLVDRASGEAMGATVWDSRADLDASASAAGQIRSTAAEVFGAGDPTAENFEVAFAELLTPANV